MILSGCRRVYPRFGVTTVVRPKYGFLGTVHWARCYSQRHLDSQSRAFNNDAKSGITSRSRLNAESFKALESSSLLQLSDEVRAALQEDRPIVALESTIYTHGLPYPENASLAVELEGILRDQGVTPATIAVIDGVAKVGLNALELHTLAASGGRPATMKVSKRDLPYILGVGKAGGKISGGTTVAATMNLAEICGIKVFATGGIGGVHRGGEDTLDISSDLTELGRSTMCVIASGCKSFLDIPRTLEYLETNSVTVATFADQDALDKVPFPAFYTRDSGVPSPLVIRSASEAAAIIYAQNLLSPLVQKQGFLLANPIPIEFAVPKDEIDAAINNAVEEAAIQGIRGHANTPFVLARIKDVTSGRSVVANRALIESNVALAAEVVKAYHNLAARESTSDAVEESAIMQDRFPNTVSKVAHPPSNSFSINSSSQAHSTPNRDLTPNTELKTGASKPLDAIQSNVDIMVFGSLAVDLACNYNPDGEGGGLADGNSHSPVLHTSNPGTVLTTLGGVGHNVALAANLAGAGKLNVQLCSYVADDLTGRAALAALKDEGLSQASVRIIPSVEQLADGRTRRNHTAQYVAINDAKLDLVLAVADMAILNDRDFTTAMNGTEKQRISSASWTVVDANLDAKAIHKVAREARNRGSKIVFEPVSVHKSTKIFETGESRTKMEYLETFRDQLIDLITPNPYELAAIYNAAKQWGFMEARWWWETIDALGIPSSGARDRFVQLTNAKMTDEGIPIQTIQLLPFIPTILAKLGPAGVLHTELLRPNDPRLTDPASAPYILSRTNNGSTKVGGVYMRLYPSVSVVEDVVSVNGAGDTFLGVLVAGLASGLPLDERLINTAQRGAVLTLRSEQAVSPELDGLISSY